PTRRSSDLPDPCDRLRGTVALISQRCNRSKARPFRPPKNSVNDLALNQTTQKGNVLRSIQQVHEAAASTQEFHCDFTGRHRGTVRGCLCRLNLVPAEKFSDHGHFEFQRHRKTGCFLTGLDDLTDDRQIKGRQQVSRLTIDESGSSKIYPLTSLDLP